MTGKFKPWTVWVAASQYLGLLSSGGTSSVSGNLRLQLDAQSAHDLQNSAEAWITLTGQCLVKALSPHARVLGKLTHATRTGNVAQRQRDEGGIVARLVHAGLQVHHHVFFGLEVFDGIPLAQFLLIKAGYSFKKRQGIPLGKTGKTFKKNEKSLLKQ